MLRAYYTSKQNVLYMENWLKKNSSLDFPGGTVDKNLPANAGDMDGLDPWSRKLPHAAEQLIL